MSNIEKIPYPSSDMKEVHERTWQSSYSMFFLKISAPELCAYSSAYNYFKSVQYKLVKKSTTYQTLTGRKEKDEKLL